MQLEASGGPDSYLAANPRDRTMVGLTHAICLFKRITWMSTAVCISCGAHVVGLCSQEYAMTIRADIAMSQSDYVDVVPACILV